MIGALLLMLASFKVFLWLTERTTMRQINYEGTRVAAGSHEPYGRMMAKPKKGKPAEPADDATKPEDIDRSKAPISWHDAIEPKDIKGKPLKLNIFGIEEVDAPPVAAPGPGGSCKEQWQSYKDAYWQQCHKVLFGAFPCPNKLPPATVVCPGKR